MSDYDNTNSGALFKNDQKQTDKHPDYRGSINVNGEEFWLSAWLKTSKAGKKFMSLNVSAKDKQGQPERRQDSAPPVDDDIPFAPLRGL